MERDADVVSDATPTASPPLTPGAAATAAAAAAAAPEGDGGDAAAPQLPQAEAQPAPASPQQLPGSANGSSADLRVQVAPSQDTDNEAAAQTGSALTTPKQTPVKPPIKRGAVTRASTGGTKDDCTLFCLRAFKAIAPLLSKRHTSLRDSMTGVLQLLDNTDAMPATIPRPSGMGDAGESSTASPLQVFVFLLRGACESGDARVIPLALDGMQKLMSFSPVSDSLEGSLSLMSFAKRARMRIPDGELAGHPWRSRRVGLLSEVVAAICSTSSFSSTAALPDEITLQTSKALLTAVTEKQVHGRALCLAVSMIFQLTVKSQTPKSLATSKAALTQVVNSVFHNLGVSEGAESDAGVSPSASPSAMSYDGASVSPSGSAGVGGGLGEGESAAAAAASSDDRERDAETGLTVEQSDAAYVFNYLASLPETVEVTELTPPEANEMRVCMNSLEILQRVVRASSPSFRTCYPFLNAIREKLFAVTIRCLVSPVNQVLQVGLSIFKSLVLTLKHHFKEEICHVFSNVIVKVLATQSASYEQKSLMIQLLLSLFQSPQVLVDIYINYDCSVNDDNLFATLLGALARFVLAHQLDPDWVSHKQNLCLKLLALQTLVAMLRSMGAWVKPDTSASSTSTSVVAANQDRPQSYSGTISFLETQKRHALKQVIEQASQAFIEKPKKGIKILVENGLLESPDSHEQLAKLFEECKKLDRQAVGDHLGDEHQTELLEHFCRLHDYTGLTLDDAIRSFLSRFSLPKEGQKIERVMECFAKTYFEMNKSDGECRNADAVFVLAVGIVMLNTDLHNPRVERKMAVKTFKAQFAAVNDGGNFREEYLETLYNNIKSNPMKDFTNSNTASSAPQADESAGLFYSAFTSRREKKSAQYTSEALRIMTHNFNLLGCTPSGGEFQGELPGRTALSVESTPFLRGSDIEHVKPMLAECWAATLAAISHLFDTNDTTTANLGQPSGKGQSSPTAPSAAHLANQDAVSQEIVKLCLEGISRAVHITSAFDMHQVRDSFCVSLCAMTGAQERLRQISYKNIAAARCLLRIPLSNGESLNSSWRVLFRTVSDIENYRSLGLRIKKHQAHLQQQQQQQHHQPQNGANGSSGGEGREVCTASPSEQHNARMFLTHMDDEAITRMIFHSTQVSEAGLKGLVSHLCAICLEDINDKKGSPRRFLLEKLVEVSSDNMGGRLLAVWNDMARLFVSVGQHPTTDIAEYGVDSLRQLVVKSIAHPELQACRIQPELLAPFAEIMESTLPGKTVRELILRCLLQLVQSHCAHIGPGFPVMFKTLISGVHRHREGAALRMTREIIHHTTSPQNISSILPYIEDLVHCVTFVAGDTKLDPEGSSNFSSGILFALPQRLALAAAESSGARGGGAAIDPSEIFNQAWGLVFESFVYLSLDTDASTRRKNIAALRAALVGLAPPTPGDAAPEAASAKEGEGEAGGGAVAEASPSPTCGGTASFWELYSTVFLSTLLLCPTVNLYIILNTTASYAHFRYFGVNDKVDRLSHKDWLSHALPELMAGVVNDVAKAHGSNPKFLECVPNILAVLCRLARAGAIREVHLAMRSVDTLLESTCHHLRGEEWRRVAGHLVFLFKHSLVRTTLFRPHFQGAEEELLAFDPTNSQAGGEGGGGASGDGGLHVDFPTAFDLCPERYREHLVSCRTEGRPDGANGEVVSPASVIPAVRSPSLLLRGEGNAKSVRKAYDAKSGEWVSMLYTQDDSGESYYESDSKLLGDMNLRCARQAGLVALLDRILFKKHFDWVSEGSRLHPDDMIDLYKCVRLCYTTCEVFFCAGLEQWRSTLGEESVVELIRRRRAKALMLSIAILFQSYDAPYQALRDVARENVVRDSLHLVHLYLGSGERHGLEPALISMINNIMALPDADFNSVEKHFFVPLCQCIPLDSATETRSAVAAFLLRTRKDMVVV